MSFHQLDISPNKTVQFFSKCQVDKMSSWQNVKLTKCQVGQCAQLVKLVKLEKFYFILQKPFIKVTRMISCTNGPACCIKVSPDEIS